MDEVIIDSTTIEKYRVDTLVSGDYYINNFASVVTCDGYDIGYATSIGNPIVADRLLLFGDFYYSELRFEDHAIGLQLSSSSNAFYEIQKIGVTAEEGVIKMHWSGRLHVYNTVIDMDNIEMMRVNIDDLPPAIWGSIDFSEGFFIHTYQGEVTSQHPIRRKFYNAAEAQTAIENMSNLYLKEYMEQNSFEIGYVLYDQQWVGNNNSDIGEIRLAYKDTSGSFHDFKYSYYSQYYPVEFPTYRIGFYIPFSTQRECNAAECANCTWTPEEIHAIGGT